MALIRTWSLPGTANLAITSAARCVQLTTAHPGLILPPASRHSSVVPDCARHRLIRRPFSCPPLLASSPVVSFALLTVVQHGLLQLGREPPWLEMLPVTRLIIRCSLSPN